MLLATIRSALATGLLLLSGETARPLDGTLPGMMSCWEATVDAATLEAEPRRKISRVMLVHYPDEWKPDAEGRFQLMLKANFRDHRIDRDDEDGFDFSIMSLCEKSGGACQCRATGSSGVWRVATAKNDLTVRIIEPLVLERDGDGSARTITPESDPGWTLGRAPYNACQL